LEDFQPWGRVINGDCGGYHGIGMIKAFKTGQMLAMLVLGEEVLLQYLRTMLMDDKRMRALKSSLATKSKALILTFIEEYLKSLEFCNSMHLKRLTPHSITVSFHLCLILSTISPNRARKSRRTKF
jgi:hypothetical protein